MNLLGNLFTASSVVFQIGMVAIIASIALLRLKNQKYPRTVARIGVGCLVAAVSTTAIAPLFLAPGSLAAIDYMMVVAIMLPGIVPSPDALSFVGSITPFGILAAALIAFGIRNAVMKVTNVI